MTDVTNFLLFFVGDLTQFYDHNGRLAGSAFGDRGCSRKT